jgi:RNA polymerase sigma factor (TIGR02999 family)
MVVPGARRSTRRQAGHEVTRLLDDWSRGNREALDALLPLVHRELHSIALRYLRRERPGHTLQPTALVNELYLRLVGERDMKWQNRAHFMAVAARLMRFILVDHCRRKRSPKRGGPLSRVTFDVNLVAAPVRMDELIALDEALTKLAALDDRKSRIAELRYFGGLSVEETAAALSVSVATVMRDWRLVKAWLHRELSLTA